MDDGVIELTKPKLRVLVEGSKLADVYNDGIKRFVVTLLNGLLHSDAYLAGTLSVDVKVLDEILPINEAVDRFVIGMPPKDKRKSQKSKPFYGVILKDLKSRLGLILYKSGIIHIMHSFFKSSMLTNSSKKYDLIHFTLPQILSPWDKSKYHLVTIHDTTHISHREYHLSENIRNAEIGFKTIKERRPYIHAISRSTYQALAKLDRTILERARLIYEGIDQSLFYPEKDESVIHNTLKEYGLERVDYIFCLATNEPRKNLANTVKGFLRFRKTHAGVVKLVIGGKPGWKSETLPTDPDVMLLGYVPDDDLRVLYSRAKVFCFVSYSEGFGLPPLEAMSCGTVPIYGDNSAMAEIIGGRGRAVDPFSVTQIASEMEFLLSNDDTRLKMELQALDFSRQFSNERFNKEIISFYRQIVIDQDQN